MVCRWHDDISRKSCGGVNGMRNKELIELAYSNLQCMQPRVQFTELLSRRTALKGVASLPLFGAAFAPIQQSAAKAFTYKAKPHTERTIACVVDRMLPGQELPGALELGIHHQIVSMRDPALRSSLRSAVDWLDRSAKLHAARCFLALDEGGQERLLASALKSNAEGAQVIVFTLRTLALRLYYSHPRISASFPYSGPPQPAGFPDFQEAPT
jgi:hypothetical protein